MSAPLPPVLPPAPTTAQTSPLPAVRGIVQAAPETATLVQGQSINAQVLSSGSGQLVLSTSLGRLVLQSTASFPPGAQVVVQIQSVGETLQVTLHLQQAAATARPAGLPGASVPDTAPASPPPAAATVTTQLTEGSIVQATVTRAAPGAASAPAPVPQGGPPATPAAGLPSQPPQAAASAAGAPAGTQGSASPLLSGGANLTLRVVTVAPPGGVLQPGIPLAGPAGGSMLVASVTGHQPGGAPIASSAGGEIVLTNAPPMPVGSRLLLEVLDLRLPAPGEPGALSQFGTRWEALNDALAALQRLDPALARQVAEMMVPTPGPRLAGSMLFFLSAVLSGDVRRFLGADAMRQLGRAPGAIGDRLARDFAQAQRTATDGNGQDWRLILVPVLTDEGLEQLRFMLRQNDDEAKETEADPGTRFMIEVTMSRLGDFQFDGLTRDKHVDLVIRTHQELPETMRDDIRSIFANTITALGFTGMIGFRAVPKFETSPVEDIADGHRDLMV